jgi:hypothetical protein
MNRERSWTARNDRNRTGSPGPSGPSVSLYLYSCAKPFRLPAWNRRRLDLISQVRSKKVLCICTNKLVDALWKSVRPLFQGALKGKTEQRRKKKNMSATDTKKATAATSQTIAELFHEAIDSWEGSPGSFRPDREIITNYLSNKNRLGDTAMLNEIHLANSRQNAVGHLQRRFRRCLCKIPL